MKDLIDLVEDTKNGNEYSMIELSNRFESLFLKEASCYSQLDSDCLQVLKESFIKYVNIYEFKNNP